MKHFPELHIYRQEMEWCKWPKTLMPKLNDSNGNTIVKSKFSPAPKLTTIHDQTST
jgi:hypothetical protein